MKKRRALQRIATAICVGSLLAPGSMFAAEHTTTITGDLTTDQGNGYSVTDNGGTLEYEFNSGDKINVSTLVESGSINNSGFRSSLYTPFIINSTNQALTIQSKATSTGGTYSTGATTDVNAYGIYYSQYAGSSLLVQVGGNTEITAEATSGDMTSTSEAAVHFARSYGISVSQSGTGSQSLVGDGVKISSKAISGDATGSTRAFTNATAVGISLAAADTAEIGQGININAEATSGAASAGSVYAESRAYGTGISSSAKSMTIGDQAQITVKATAGKAYVNNSTTGYTYADADAQGIRSSNSNQLNIGNNLKIQVESYAGSQSEGGKSGSASSLAYGINQTSRTATVTIGDNNQISAAAYDGKWGSAYEGASMAYGLYMISSQLTLGENNVIEAEAYADQTVESKRANAVAMGVLRVGGTSNIGNNTTIRVKTVGGKSTDSLDTAAATSYGYRQGGGTSTFSGDLEIVTEAQGGTYNGAQAPSNVYALYAHGGGLINVNQGGGNQIRLTGDLATTDVGYSGSGYINVKLDNEESYLRGLVNNIGGNIRLDLTNGGRWQPTGDGNISSNASLYISDGGMVDLSWWNNRNGWNPSNAYRTFYNNYAHFGNGGAVIQVNSDVANDLADKMVIGFSQGGGTQYVQVGYDPIINSLTGAETVTLTSELGIPVLELQGASVSDFDVIGKKSTLDSPLMRFEFDPYVVYDPDTKIAKIYSVTTTGTPEDPLAETPLTNADSQFAFRNLWYLENDNMLRRLGDLRLKNEKAENGIWARVYHGSLKNESSYGRHFDQDFTGLQLGYDRQFDRKSGKYYLGAMVNHMYSDPSYERGDGDLKSTGFGIYGSWMSQKGHYVDLVLRASRMSNEYTLVDYSGNFASGDYDAWAYGISAEYGYRKDLSEKWFVEPQAQVMFGHIGSGDHTASNGLKVKQSSINPAWGRLGLLIGHNFKGRDGEQRGNVYLRGSWLKGLGGSGSLGASYNGIYRSVDTVDNDDSAFELNLGTNLHVGEKTDLYFELAKTFGGNVELNWRINAGVRFSW